MSKQPAKAAPKPRPPWDESRVRDKTGKVVDNNFMKRNKYELHYMADADGKLKKGKEDLFGKKDWSRLGLVTKRKGQKHADGTKHLIDCKCMEQEDKTPPDDKAGTSTPVGKSTGRQSVPKIQTHRIPFKKASRSPSPPASPVPSFSDTANTDENLTARAKADLAEQQGLAAGAGSRGPNMYVPGTDDSLDSRSQSPTLHRSHSHCADPRGKSKYVPSTQDSYDSRSWSPPLHSFQSRGAGPRGSIGDISPIEDSDNDFSQSGPMHGFRGSPPSGFDARPMHHDDDDQRLGPQADRLRSWMGVRSEDDESSMGRQIFSRSRGCDHSEGYDSGYPSEGSDETFGTYLQGEDSGYDSDGSMQINGIIERRQGEPDRFIPIAEASRMANFSEMMAQASHMEAPVMMSHSGGQRALPPDERSSRHSRGVDRDLLRGFSHRGRGTPFPRSRSWDIDD